MINSIKKGKSGEVEFCTWLFDNFGIDVQRNYNQAQGGADIIIKDFIFEIKRREVLDLDSWWLQICIAKKKHKNENLIPVVAFRKNRQKWQFLIPANLIHGIEKGYLQCTERVFIELMSLFVIEVNCSGGCDKVGYPNFNDKFYYCGSSERCIP